MKAVHTLKTWPVYFNAMESGDKRHEVRKNDRGFSVGDTLILREYDPEADSYSGRELICEVTYLTLGGSFGLPDDLCVMSVAPLMKVGA